MPDTRAGKKSLYRTLSRRGLVLPELGKLYATRTGVAAVSKRIQRVFEDAGIDTGLKVEGYSRAVAQVGFHSLRHAHITALLENGIPMDAVRQQAGHASLEMTARYYRKRPAKHIGTFSGSFN